MANEKQFAVVQQTELKWPVAFPFSVGRFRLFVAADVNGIDRSVLSDFALAALKQGMVYFCAWGRDCERFHDVLDQIIAKDEAGDRRFAGPTEHDTVMTTWHAHESLEEALEFFGTAAVPTDGFRPDSESWLAICVGNQSWAATARQFLESRAPLD
jgi:hypothetical protein